MTTFSSEFPAADDALQVLRKVWGYDAFRPLQQKAVSDVIEGRDSLVVLPTGGGKSLCYQVPALVREGMAVVVSPLISLMKDQVDGLVSNGVRAALVNSSQSDDQKRETADAIRRGELDLLYMAPEGLLTERTLDFLAKQSVSFFAIDEAHCVSAWGHDFRPEYRELRVLKQRFPGASVHAFTATASERVRDDIAEQLDLQQPSVLVGDFDRPNLIYRMIRADSRLDQILEVIGRHRGESGIVYCITRKEVEQTTAALVHHGISARPYHAGLDDADRKKNQEDFIQEQVDVVVATIAFGMGIDKPNVRYVIHRGMPKSIENYQQESGRAGRDGLDSECVLIHGGGDVMTWKRILELGDAANLDASMRSVNAMADLCAGVRCRHASLVEYFGQEYAVSNCGACDVCLGELDLIDNSLTLAQKILSCVYRLKQRYGAGHTAKVLIGSRDQKILQAEHDQLSTYGLLSDEGSQAVRTWIEQLVSQGFLQRVGEYQTLTITPSGMSLMRGDGEVRFTRSGNQQKPARMIVAEDDWDGVDRGLFDHLRHQRGQLASQRGVPAYVIFGDAVLRSLARVRPTDLNQLTRIQGIGEKKRDEYGELFLQAIDSYCESHPLPRDVLGFASKTPAKPPARKAKAPAASASQAADHFKQGKSIADVAQLMGRAESTAAGYLNHYLQHNKITDPSPWVAADRIPTIEAAIAAADDSRLKPIHEALGGEISYEEIRVVKICLSNRQETT